MIADSRHSPATDQGEAAPQGGARLAYQPALDGMRGLAVAAVLAYHAGMPWARGGFLGVDAFFVLSGYLITSLLLTEWRAVGTIGFAAFWARRARRLLPALFLLLAAVAAYAVIFAEEVELAKLRGDALATLGYVANWRPIFAQESYFEQFSIPSPLRHTWSLAIEEQWYVVWPLAIAVLVRLRRGSLGPLVAASLLMIAGSALLMALLYDPHGNPSRVYYGTDTRAQSLLVGAVLAILLLRLGPVCAVPARGTLQIAGLICASYIGWAWMTTPDDSVFLYRGGFLVLAVAVAVVIVAAVQPSAGLIRAALSFQPLRGLGLISYGVYLWHWPIYLVLTPDRSGWDGYGLFAVRVLVTLTVALASYYVVEMPLRRGAFQSWKSSWVLAPAVAAGLAVALVLSTGGEAPTYSVSTLASADMPPSISMPRWDTTAVSGVPPARVLVVGDSVALTMAQGLARAESEWNISVWNTGRLGCGVLRGDAVFIKGSWVDQRRACNDWPSRWRSYVDVFQPDVVVVLVGAWDTYDREVDGRLLEFGTPEADAHALRELRNAVTVLSSDGAKVMLLTTPYFQTRNLALVAAEARFEAWRIDRLNSLYRKVEEEHPGQVQVLDLNSLVSTNGGMQNDGVHFTHKGADMVASWLAPIIVEAAPEREASVSASPKPAHLARVQEPPSRWLELLGHVPDTSDVGTIAVMNDYARFRDTFDVALPGRDAGAEDLFDYFRQLLFDHEGRSRGLAPAALMGMTEFPPPLEDMRRERGFTIADVEQDISVAEPGRTAHVQVLRGSFEKAVAKQAVRGDFLYWCAATEDLESLIDAGSGKRASLADRDDFRLLAHGLDGLNTYTALFSDDTGSFSSAGLSRKLAGTDASAKLVEDLQAELERQAQLMPFQAFATGAGVDSGGPFTAIILLHPDDETARSNARRLRGRIDEGVSWLSGQPFRAVISGADVSHDKRLVVLKLRTNALALWFGLLSVGDTLLLYE